MQGINILNQTAVTENPDWFFPTVFGSIILAVVLFIICLITVNINWFSNLCGILWVVGLVFAWILAIVDPEVPTGRYRYECTIDKSVSIQDIYDNYEVIEQRGELWILEDKEDK